MNPWHKHLLVGLVLWPVGGVLLMLLAHYLDDWLIIPGLIGWIVVIQKLLNSQKCGSCGKPLFHWRGASVYWTTGDMNYLRGPHKCWHCGSSVCGGKAHTEGNGVATKE
jgi:hypothetical protein